ncbi:RDD family protein [Streptococcus sinensis]|uniref:RDD family protein n=1 Tax=Streptococcus sinensis TaxID=176090 RepID=UPI001C2EF4D9|nr:RDD family protein [Streptococcus sinensis]MCD1277151.1 hypothetical protein [Streptococcus sinensis]
MKLKTDNPIPVKTRLKELLGDWLFISFYLISLFLLAMGFYNLVLGGIPTLTESQSQLLAFSTSVLPLTVIFAWLDYRKGSFGKRWAGLRLVYKHKSLSHSLLRSSMKFFPWQLGHMGAIRSAYQADTLSIFLSTSAGILFLTFLLMGLLSKDKRYPADLLAGTQVQLKH